MSLRPLKIVLFVGSTRMGRMGARVSAFIQNHMKGKGYDVDVFDPVELKFPVLQQPVHFYPDPSQAPEWLHGLNARIQAADAYVVVSGEYNNAIPPALTNMMNHFPPKNYSYKPSLIITYSAGRYGGSIASSQLRTFLSMMGCPSVPITVSIPEVGKSLDESGLTENEHLNRRAEKALEQFDWVASAYKEKKLKDGQPEYVM